MHVKEWKRESGEVIGIPFGRRIFYMSVLCSLAVFSSIPIVPVPYLVLQGIFKILKNTKPLS